MRKRAVSDSRSDSESPSLSKRGTALPGEHPITSSYASRHAYLFTVRFAGVFFLINASNC